MPGPSQVVAVVGFSGSGKTTLVDKIAKHHGPEKCLVISIDRYYKGLQGRPLAARREINFDDPGELDLDRLVADIRQLRLGNSVRLPRYSFETSSRLEETDLVEPQALILIEGILGLHAEDLRKLIDVALFVDTPEEVCLRRRVNRDQEERGREEADIMWQYENQVKPMQDRYVTPSKEHAHLVVDMEECPKEAGLQLDMKPVLDYLEMAGIGGELAYGQALRLHAKAVMHDAEIRGHDGVIFSLN
jgi:uridine kinase